MMSTSNFASKLYVKANESSGDTNILVLIPACLLVSWLAWHFWPQTTVTEGSHIQQVVFLAPLLAAVMKLCSVSVTKTYQARRVTKRSRCPFSGSTSCSNTNSLSLCPFSGGSSVKPAKRTCLKPVSVRPFEQNNTKKNSFWDLYKEIASEQTGFFGEHVDMNSAFPSQPKSRAIISLAEDEAAQEYMKANADGYRTWLQEKLVQIDKRTSPSGASLQDEITDLSTAELKVLLGACVYLRHSWHQGNPSVDPLAVKDPLDSIGRPMEEPSQLTLVLESVSQILDVDPYLNMHTWLLCNWKWTSNQTTTNDHQQPTFQEICNLKSGFLSPRFNWFTGDARESEINLWRAFAYSEFMAAPLYGWIGKLLDEVDAFERSVCNHPSSDVIGNVLKSLNSIHDITHNIMAALVSFVRPDLIDFDHFSLYMSTAHYAGTSAGASGYQMPCIVVLDSLLATDYEMLSRELQSNRQANIEKMQPKVASLILDGVLSRSNSLKGLIAGITCPALRREVEQAFNSIVDELIKWRGSHRARAGKFLKTSAVTTGRSEEAMGGETVHASFLREMNEIVRVTKACRI